MSPLNTNAVLVVNALVLEAYTIPPAVNDVRPVPPDVVASVADSPPAVPLVLAALFGMSADTNCLKVAVVADPVAGPAYTSVSYTHLRAHET